MANGNQTFKELREMVAEGRKITTTTALRLIMAGVADIHDTRGKDMEHIKIKLDEIRSDMVKIKNVTKYPSAYWYLMNKPLKLFAFLAVVTLAVAIVFFPEARSWAIEQLIKTFLGGL